MLMKKKQSALYASVLLLMSLFTVAAPSVLLAEEDCAGCHPDLAAGKNLHQAVSMGCKTCHSAIDAADVPHKKTNNINRGLSLPQPDLCYGCHDKEKFTNKKVHVAIAMGCTSCHNPHVSENAKLLKTALPVLCFDCHDKTMFEKKVGHGPASSGQCLLCHAAHASDHKFALLINRPAELCVSCHEGVVPHLVSGMHKEGHPVGLTRKKGGSKSMKDPLRPKKPFYCGSCHDPHGSDNIYSLRFPAASAMGICTNCHK
jgi:predicted CXXCH cytochrome family protein